MPQSIQSKLSNKPWSVFLFALMPKSSWPERCDLTDRHCFSTCDGLNFPVGRYFSLWVIVKLFQVLAVALWIGPDGFRGSSTFLVQNRCNLEGRRIKKTTATVPLIQYTKPQPWSSVEMLQAADPIIQIIRLIKVKCHQEGTLNSHTSFSSEDLISSLPQGTLHHAGVRERKNTVNV